LKAHDLVAQRYANATCHVVEPTEALCRVAQRSLAKPWWQPGRWRGAQVEFQSPADGTVNMVWANMSLHMAADPQAWFKQWQALLGVDGFLMFSCLGPDTLRELRNVYATLGWPAPSHAFTDMHDWGDMLVEAGFAEPVMDMERITLTYASPQRLLEDLRAMGRNLNVARFTGLRGRAWRARLEQALASSLCRNDADGQLALTLTFEVAYGHAFKPVPRPRIDGQTAVSLADMRAMLHVGRSGLR
jgi:malonyl-CoA O-methyltransferase